jgi:hypothetical protein
MTYYQEQLVQEAIDMWERGHRIPMDLYANLAQEGMDVPALEIKHFKES